MLRKLKEKIKDLVILSAQGYQKVVMFQDNARATLKVMRDEEEEDDIDTSLYIIVKKIKAEIRDIEHEKDRYQRRISKSIASESVSETLQMLLQKLSPSLDADSLTSILIGNMVTSVLRSRATPLQIALGVLIHKKKVIQHLYDYKVTCSYDELRRYKKSSAVARYTKLREEERTPVTVSGLVQHIADNFDAEMSSPNGKISTHSLAMIECFTETDVTIESESFPRISKAEMLSPVHFDEQEDEMIHFTGERKPLPPAIPPSNLPQEFCEKQRVSNERAGDMDFDFLKVSE